MMNNNEAVANEIIRQLGGQGKLRAMVNAKFMSYTDSSVTFKFSGSNKMNTVTINLNSMDLYDITFAKFSPSKFTFKTVKESNGIYNDQLINLFETTTGLYLSL